MKDFQVCPRKGGKATVVRILKRSYEEQKKLRARYLMKKGINYDTPGSERHE